MVMSPSRASSTRSQGRRTGFGLSGKRACESRSCDQYNGRSCVYVCMCVCVTSVLPAVRACCAFVLISGRKNAQKRVVTV